MRHVTNMLSLVGARHARVRVRARYDERGARCYWYAGGAGAADEEKGAGRQGGQGDCSELSVTDKLIYFTSRRRHVVIGVTTASPQATGVTHVARAKLPL